MLGEGIPALRQALAAHVENPAQPELFKEFARVRAAVARLIAELPRRDAQSPIVDEIRQVVQELSRSGANDQAVAPDDATLAVSSARQGWPGLLAAMLLVPAWRWPSAPRFEDVPDWLWADYSGWLFAQPQGFTETGDADAYARHVLAGSEDLLKWVRRNRGAAVVKAALSAYLETAKCIALYFSEGSLRRHLEIRAELLMAGYADPVLAEEIEPEPRTGRRLRVGIVNRAFGPQAETYGTLPTFEHLDPARFEVILFACGQTRTPIEDYCRSRAAELRFLPPTIEAQVAEIRNARLDVVAFGTNLSAVFNEITRLALYRLAPLQVVNMSTCTTSGLPNSDLYVSGTLADSAVAAEGYTERLALIQGPAHAFEYRADHQEPTGRWTRAQLSLPEDAVVFVTAANYFKIIPEMREAWAKLLAAVPGSRLVVHPFNPNWASDYPAKRFCAEFDAVLRRHGVAEDRLIVSTIRFPSRSDVKELLRVGDIYLDTYPFGGVNSLVDPLELGLPVVAWSGGAFRARMGASLMHSLGLGDLVAESAETYHRLVVDLATDPAKRAACAARTREAMHRGAVFLDPLAHSDAFGDLLVTAFDELCAVGRREFRGRKDPIMGTEALPATSEARRARARTLIGEGRGKRALLYLQAEADRSPRDPAVLLELAQALRADGRSSDAVRVVREALRLDGNLLDGWLLSFELAAGRDQWDLAREIGQILGRLGPSDSRVCECLARLQTRFA